MELNHTFLRDIGQDAIEMALHCGRIQLKAFRSSDIGIDTKSNIYDVVTNVDKECEDYLIQQISTLYPSHSIIGEETGRHIKDNYDWAWVIDPLDGTNSYSQGLPVFCVSIGVKYKDEPVVGVVYAPYLDELYTAIKGEGAFYRKPFTGSKIRKISVSSKTDIGQCVVGSGFPYDKASNPKNNIPEATAIIPLVRGFRRMGSAAYDLCCTSMGTLDAYWEYNLKEWDACAGEVIVKEAGGTIVSLCDDRNVSILAGPVAIVNKIIEIFGTIDNKK